LQRSSDDIVEHLSARTIPCAPIYDLPEVVCSPQVAARNMMVTVKDPIAGDRQIVGNPIKMSATDDRFAPTPHDCGEDTDSVLTRVGFSGDDIARLRKHQIIG
jgi:crotonobetainyl-CoA:carnitine CoA-transferase CaiB-like acyl-CoA transferase